MTSSGITSYSSYEDMTTSDVTFGNRNLTTTVYEVTGYESDDDENGLDHPLYNISEKLFLVAIGVITFGGVICNCLMLVTMRRPSMKRTPQSVYMSALACSDCLVLVLDFMNNWLRNVSGYQVKSSSDWFCRLYNFIFSSSYTYSGWLIVGIAMERVIIVWFPLKARSLCTLRKAVIVVVVLAVACPLINSYNLVIWTIFGTEDGKCAVSERYEEINRQVLIWMSFAAYSYVPVLLLILSNTAILVGLFKASKIREQLSGEQYAEMRKVTITVVTICMSYTCLTVPITLFYAILFATNQFVSQSPGMALGRTIIIMLGLSNHAINFFLYVLTSVNFRKEVKAMFRMSRQESYTERSTERTTKPISETTLSQVA